LAALDVESGDLPLIKSNHNKVIDEADTDDDGTNSLPKYSAIIPENTPVILSWENVVVSTKKDPPKILLNKISGSVTGLMLNLVSETLFDIFSFSRGVLGHYGWIW
jgi:hypothetical protein